MKQKMVYIVARTTAETDKGGVMEVMGAFSTEVAARAHCSAGEWIGPLPLDKRLPETPEAWPGAYYPDPPVTDDPADATRELPSPQENVVPKEMWPGKYTK